MFNKKFVENEEFDLSGKGDLLRFYLRNRANNHLKYGSTNLRKLTILADCSDVILRGETKFFEERKKLNSDFNDFHTQLKTNIRIHFNKGKLNRGPWNKDEDEKLRKLVGHYGARNWSFIAEKIGTRMGKQCRERWHNHLNPSVNKNPFTKEEKLLIIQLHSKLGNKWSTIAKHLKGRTDNSIKNFFNSLRK
ncbi:MYBB [Hepatospora eriocheir]|uniref:MYBB n=1 Tax=Hepatospora eriocheir TaxID=1081669 RepID=A0A1X0QGX0_9MICR|nr:MYBB [Hepatospora eriocheir]